MAMTHHWNSALALEVIKKTLAVVNGGVVHRVGVQPLPVQVISTQGTPLTGVKEEEEGKPK